MKVKLFLNLLVVLELMPLVSKTFAEINEFILYLKPVVISLIPLLYSLIGKARLLRVKASQLYSSLP